MSRLKVLLIFSSIFFVICVFLAFFSGSSIFWSLFKAVVSTCLAIAFLAVANFFLAKYIPDFFEDKTRLDEADTTNIVGANVDIKINDSHLSSLEHDDKMPSSDASSPKPVSFEVNESSTKEENTQDLSSPDFQPTSFSSENKDLNAENETPLPIDNMQKTPSELNAEVHVDDANLSETELSEALEKDVDRLEELPDLQEFVDTSNLQGEQTKGDELMNTGTQSFFATDLSEDVTDTKLMAKAVRTVLKREV